MSELIERIARALYECPGSDMLAKTDGFPKPSWENAHVAVKDNCRVKARAAIEAMRDLPKDIIEKVDGSTCGCPCCAQWTGRYVAAIDAALTSNTAKPNLNRGLHFVRTMILPAGPPAYIKIK